MLLTVIHPLRGWYYIQLLEESHIIKQMLKNFIQFLRDLDSLGDSWVKRW